MARRQPEYMAMSFNWAVVSGGSSRVTGEPFCAGAFHSMTLTS